MPASRKWILVVDDDSSVRLMLARVLAGEGYGVLTAASGEQALELTDIARVDLVLLDINMPGTNGWTALRQLQAKSASTAIILITACANQGPAARQAGVETVLEKPLHFPTLLECVTAAIEQPAAPHGQATQEPLL